MSEPVTMPCPACLGTRCVGPDLEMCEDCDGTGIQETIPCVAERREAQAQYEDDLRAARECDGTFPPLRPGRLDGGGVAPRQRGGEVE